jgi:hypothetical protein
MKISLRTNLWAIGFAMIFPTIVTLLYFVVLANQLGWLQVTAAGVGKAIQFAFPAVWVFVVLRKKFKWTRVTPDGVGLGVGFGLLIGGAMVALTMLWLEPIGFFDGPGAKIRHKIEGFQISSPAAFIALGVFYALCHSILEEYYWRWFVFKRLRPYTTLNRAIVVSSLGFMAHHVIVLATYFGWASPVTYVFSLAVAIGGAVWAWIYDRSDSLYGPWVSHMLIDAAIFVIGYNLAFG